MKNIVLLLTAFLLTTAIQATHLLGGAIGYNFKSATAADITYTVSVTLYRDCEASTVQFDNTVSLAIYNVSNKQLNKSYTMNYKNSEYLPSNCNSNFTICIQSVLYEKDITIENNTAFYLFSSTCCRTSLFNTFLNPSPSIGNSLVLISYLPSSKYKNNSPQFNFKPTTLLESNIPSFADWSASDVDGDSLVYKIIPPFSGSQNYSLPEPSKTLNDTGLIKYNQGYSSIFPLGILSEIKINPTNGIISYFNPMTGNYAFCTK